MKTKWAYKVETLKSSAFSISGVKAETIKDALNRRGLDGWELVNAYENSMAGTVSMIRLYFKRPF